MENHNIKNGNFRIFRTIFWGVFNKSCLKQKLHKEGDPLNGSHPDRPPNVTRVNLSFTTLKDSDLHEMVESRAALMVEEGMTQS